MLDRRERWDPVTLTATERGTVFKAWRLAASPSGGVWVVDRIQRKLAMVVGEPLPDRPGGPPAPDVFRPSPENPNPPRIIEFPAATWPDNEEAVAMACSAQGRPALLTWPAGADAAIRSSTSDGRFGPPSTLEGAGHPYSIAWVSDTDIAALVADTSADPINEAPVYTPLETGGVARPLGDFYPLRHHRRRSVSARSRGAAPLPFIVGAGAARAALAAVVRGPRRGQQQQAVRRGAAGRVASPVSRGRHSARLRRARVARGERRGPRCRSHMDQSGTNTGSVRFRRRRPVPCRRAHGCRSRREIPFHPGLLGCARAQDRSGLFTALVQRAGFRVRTLRGRYLWAHVELFGTGRS